MVKFFNKAGKISEGDITIAEDLSIAVMNLISIEEHLAFSFMKSNNKKYFELINVIRKIRAKYLEKLIKSSKYENWCISKHLLSIVMRLLESSNKLFVFNREDEAIECLKDANYLYDLFLNIMVENG